MRDVVLFCEWGNYDERDPIPRVVEVAIYSRAGSTDIPTLQIDGRHAVGIHRRLRRGVIIKAAGLVIRKYKKRNLPGRGGHEAGCEGCGGSNGGLYFCFGGLGVVFFFKISR